MPRRARIAIAGIPWHIIQRGNNRADCFHSVRDYRYYLRTLSDQAVKHGCAVHAYVLMTNHIHLLLTPETTDGASLLMKQVGQRYTQYINRNYSRTGTLWEGRFKSCLTQEETYVLACYRYIEMNPVRARMVSDPADYPWSSYHCNALGKTDEQITQQAVYLALSENNRKRIDKYRDLTRTAIPQSEIDEIRRSTNGNFVLGNDAFKTKMCRLLGRRVVPGSPGRPRRDDRNSFT